MSVEARRNSESQDWYPVSGVTHADVDRINAMVGWTQYRVAPRHPREETNMYLFIWTEVLPFENYGTGMVVAVAADRQDALRLGRDQGMSDDMLLGMATERPEVVPMPASAQERIWITSYVE